MRSRVVLLVALSGASLVWACRADPRSAEGFRLPPGDPVRGQAAFVASGCSGCHRVDGASLPAPMVTPPVPVVLGGLVDHARTDGDLVTSIIHPSHRFARGYPAEQIASGGVSRMSDSTETMTVRQLIDVVAFLQSRYVVVRPGATPAPAPAD